MPASSPFAVLPALVLAAASPALAGEPVPFTAELTPIPLALLAAPVDEAPPRFDFPGPLTFARSLLEGGTISSEPVSHLIIREVPAALNTPLVHAPPGQLDYKMIVKGPTEDR